MKTIKTILLVVTLTVIAPIYSYVDDHSCECDNGCTHEVNKTDYIELYYGTDPDKGEN